MYGIARGGEAKAAGEAAHVGIHRNALYYTVCISEYHVCSFARYPAKGKHLAHGARYNAAKFLFEHVCGGENTFCFCMVKSGWFDERLKVFLIEPEVVVKSRILFEKSSRHLIYLFVGALRREDDRHQELPVGLIAKRYGSARIRASKAGENFSCPLEGRVCPIFLGIHFFHTSILSVGKPC